MCVWGGGGGYAYADSQTTLLHICMKTLNKIESPVFVLFVFFVSKGNLLDSLFIYGVCFIITCSSSLLHLVPRGGCAS